MKEVKYVELVFENCEDIKIKAKDIIWIDLDHISKSIYRMASNCICSMNTAKSLDLIIKKDADVDTSNIYGDYTWKERIFKYDDITSIYITYEDDSEESYFLDWEDAEGNQCENKNQISKNIKEYVFLYVGKNKEIMMNNLVEICGDDIESYSKLI